MTETGGGSGSIAVKTLLKNPEITVGILSYNKQIAHKFVDQIAWNDIRGKYDKNRARLSLMKDMLPDMKLLLTYLISWQQRQ